MANNNPKGPAIYDTQSLIAAGIDPKTGLPIKLGNCNTEDTDYKSNLKLLLRVLDEQNAVNRYRWYNLPDGLTGQLLERMLYYKGQLMFFYMPTDETFYMLPYALDGDIDILGRFRRVTPLPFNGKAQDKKNAWITGLTREVVYELPLEVNIDMFDGCCVLLRDYTNQMSETIIPRQILQDPLLDLMAESVPMARTSLLANSGIKAMRVNDEDQQSNVKAASRSVTKAALTGNPWIPIVGQLDFQDLTSGGALKADEYLQYMQSLDNLRLSFYGLKNGGVFEKDSAYVNTITAGNIQNNVGLVYQDGLAIRQHFCDLVNSIWGLGIWCESSEVVTNTDANLDGEVSDSEVPLSTQPAEEETYDIEQ